MAFTPNPHTPYQWQDAPSTGTPLDSAHLEAAEADIISYVQTSDEALDTYLEGILAPLASPTFTGVAVSPAFAVSGLAGATAASRYVGATASGAPASGTFLKGDYIVDQTGSIWICTTAGTPGTWTQAGGGLSGGTTATGALDGTFNAPRLSEFRTVKNNPWSNAKGGAKTFTANGSATASSTAFADTTNTPFASGDVGKTIIIPGAGTGGKAFSTTIAGFTDSGHVTLTAAPVTTVSGAYQFGWDDTTAIQATLNNIGFGTVFFGNDTYLWTSLVPKAGVTIQGGGGHAWQIPGQSNAMFYGRQTDGTTFYTGFRCYSMNFHGEGILTATGTDGQLDAVWLQQWTDVYLVDCTADGFADSAFSMRDVTRCWYIRLKATNSCHGSGRNALVFGSSTMSPGDFFCIGCYTSGIGTAALSINSQSGNNTVGPAVVTNCDFTASGFAVITTETNEQSGVEAKASRVIIANNNLNNIGTGASAMCVYVQDDTGTGAFSTDPLKIADYVVQGNTCYAASASAGNAAITLFASRTTVSGNTIVTSGINNRCILVKQNTGNGGDTTVMQNIDLMDNKCYSTNASGTQNMIEVNNATRVRVWSNKIVCQNTAGGDGIRIAGGCQYVQVFHNLVDTAAFNGIAVVSMKDVQVKFNTVYNPNANNTASTSSGCGINIFGTAPSGSLNEVNYNTVYDDRGTHQMLYAALQNGSGSPNPTLIGNTFQGALTNITNAVANWSYIKNNRTDSAAFPAGSSAPAAPATTVNLGTTTYPRKVYWYGGTVTVVNQVPSGGTTRQIGNGSPGMAYLEPGDDMNWTYSAAPSLAVFPVA